jgi:hypothetical protein
LDGWTFGLGYAFGLLDTLRFGLLDDWTGGHAALLDYWTRFALDGWMVGLGFAFGLLDTLRFG